MKQTDSNPSARFNWLWIVALLGLVLAVMFGRSFVPGLVHFSNDGPLGAQNASFLRPPQSFLGMWNDLNSIGMAAGSFPPSITAVLDWALGPVGFAKFLVPVALLIAGLGAAFCFRRLGFAPWVCAIGALAVALNSDFLSTACWGVASQIIAFGMDFLAVGLVVSAAASRSRLRCWLQVALAGMAVGINVMEAADIGALFSLLIAGFVVWYAWSQEGPAVSKLARGVSHTLVVALFAGFIAASTVVSLVSNALPNSGGAGGSSQEPQAIAANWSWATQWSLPKSEALSFAVPGLFGYRMDTPQGGNYWGGVGRDLAWDSYFANGKQGAAPQGLLRFSGGGIYAGVTVILVAAWAAAQSLRRKDSVFSLKERKLLWFWCVVLLLTLLLAFGRFAPFYKLLYGLPYFSSIRNPAKFVHLVTFALLIMFGYGLEGLARRYMQGSGSAVGAASAGLKGAWARLKGFDRRWLQSCLLALGLSLVGWLMFAASREGFLNYLAGVGFADKALSEAIADFSVRQVGWFVLFLALASAWMLLLLAGLFRGQRARTGLLLMGLLVAVDLGWKNQPWIIYWDYTEKYATNPIIELLRHKPYEQRVAILPEWLYQAVRPTQDSEMFTQLYRIEWAQHHFQYFDIQSLDVVQNPRPPADLSAFEQALHPHSLAELPLRTTRRWELTNTRYLLGTTNLLELLNQQIDPEQRRFRILQQFDVGLKPGLTSATKLEQLTAIPSPSGACALFEFTGALPRVKLFSQWQVLTNDAQSLQQLVSASFKPEQSVLVASPLPSPGASTNQAAGSVEFTSYKPTDLRFKAQAACPAVLLLNDHYDANWKAYVDEKPVELLRCNFIMRGVFLSAGTHQVRLRFEPAVRPLYVSLAAIGSGLLLLGLLGLTKEPEPAPAPAASKPAVSA